MKKGFAWPFDMTITVLFFILVGFIIFIVLATLTSQIPSGISETGFNLFDAIFNFG